MLGLRCPKCGGSLALEPFADAAGGAELRCLLCGHQTRRFERAEWEFWRLHGRLPTRAELYGDPTPDEPRRKPGRPLGTHNRGTAPLYAEMARRRAAGETIEQVAFALGWSRRGVSRALMRLRSAGERACGP